MILSQKITQHLHLTFIIYSSYVYMYDYYRLKWFNLQEQIQYGIIIDLLLNIIIFGCRMNIQQIQQKVNEIGEKEEMIFFTLKRYEEEENAVFIDYQVNALVNWISTYKQLNIYKRTALAKNMQSIKTIITPECFCSLLQHLAQDFMQIQLQLLSFINQQLTKHLNNDYIHSYITSIKIIILSKGQLQIKLKSCTLMSQILQHLLQKQRQSIFEYADELISNQKDDIKAAGIFLLGLIARYRSCGQIEDHFKNKLQERYNSSSQHMRKEIIHYCSIIAKYVSQPFLNEQIISAFIDQKIKQKVWAIRKSCVQILPSLIQYTKSKKQHLADTLLALTLDVVKIVKLAAFKVIPEFIAKYQQSDISEKLINIYASLADHQINKQANSEDQIIEKIVFYLPGVLATIGAAKWDKISALFSKFLFYKNFEIKLALCSSLHEICKLLGAQIAEDYIIKALNYFIFNQTFYELKLTALSNISLIIAVFDPPVRQNFIDIFMVIQQDSIMWRYKYVIADQIQQFSKLYSPEDIYCYVFPIIFKLCSDSVEEVRKKAANNIHHLLFTIRQGKNLIENAMEFIKTLATSKDYHQRQMFCRITRNLYKMPQFANKMKSLIFQLSKDKVIEVRICLAIIFNTILLQDGKQSLANYTQALLHLKNEEQTNEYFQQAQ